MPFVSVAFQTQITDLNYIDFGISQFKLICVLSKGTHHTVQISHSCFRFQSGKKAKAVKLQKLVKIV